MRPRDHIGYTTVAKILDPVAKTFRVWALDLPPSESSESARLRTPFVVVQCGAPRADAVRMALANQGLHQVVSRVVDARDGAVSLAMYGKSTRLVDRDVLAWLEVGMEMVSRSTSDASARELQFRGTPSRVGRRTVLISWRSPLSPEGLSSRVVRIAYRDYR